MGSLIVSQEVWADAEGKPVPFGDVRGKTVLFGQGQQISAADAKKYSIGEDGKYQEPDRDDFPPTGKAVESAPRNKAVEMAPKKK